MGRSDEDRNSTIRGYFADLQNIRPRYLLSGFFRLKDLIRRKLSSMIMAGDEESREKSSSPRKDCKSPMKKSKLTGTSSSSVDRSKSDVKTDTEKSVRRGWYAEFLAKYFHDEVCICEKRNLSKQRRLPRYSIPDEPKIYSIGLLTHRCTANPATDFANNDRPVENLKNCLAVIPENAVDSYNETDSFPRKLLRRKFYQGNHEFSKTRRKEVASRLAGSFCERQKIEEWEESKAEGNFRGGVGAKVAKRSHVSARSKGSQTCICMHHRRRKRNKMHSTEKNSSENTEKFDNNVLEHSKDREIKRSRRRKTQTADMTEKCICIPEQEVVKTDSVKEVIGEERVCGDAEVERRNYALTSIKSERNLSKDHREAIIHYHQSASSQALTMIFYCDDSEEEEQSENVGRNFTDSLELIREPEFLSDTTLDLSTGSFLDSLKNESSRTSTASGIFKSRERVVWEKMVETEILGNIKRRIDKDIDHSLDTDEEDAVDFRAQLHRTSYFARDSSRRENDVDLDEIYSSNESLSSTSLLANNQSNSTFIKGHYLPLKELDTMDLSLEANDISEALEDNFTQVPEVRNTDFPFDSINSFNEQEDKYSGRSNTDVFPPSFSMNPRLSENTLTEKRARCSSRKETDSFSLPLIASDEKKCRKHEERHVYGQEFSFVDFTSSSLAAGDQRRSGIINTCLNYPSRLDVDEEKVKGFSDYPSMLDFNIEGYSPSLASIQRRNSLAYENPVEDSRAIKDTSTLFYSTTCFENLKKSKHRSSVIEKRLGRNSREEKTFLFRRFLSMNLLSDLDGHRKADRTVADGNHSVREFEKFAGQVAKPPAIHYNQTFLRASAKIPSKCNDRVEENIDDNCRRIENMNFRRFSSTELLTRQKSNRPAKFQALSRSSHADFHGCENVLEELKGENAKEVVLCPARIDHRSLPVCDFNMDDACSADLMDRLVNVAVSKFTEKLILFERNIEGRLRKIREKKRSLKFTQSWTYSRQSMRGALRGFAAGPFSRDMRRIWPYASDEETFATDGSSPSLSSDSEVEIPREKAETRD